VEVRDVNFGKRFSPGVLLAGTLLGGLLLSGCDDNVEVIHDPDIHIRKGMTWAWRPMGAPAQKAGDTGRPVVSRDVIANPAPAPPPPQHLESNWDWNTEANRSQLQEAIKQTLKSKGLVQVDNPATADFLVDYHVAVKTHNATVQTVNPGWGWGWGWGPPEVGFQNVRYSDGTFVIDLALRNPRKLAYRAISHKSLNNKTTISPYQAQEAVNALLKGLKPQ
jgi:Domain of unknown function (DUF4136)